MVLQKRPMMLMILDGFGLSDNYRGNAIAHAHKPNLDRIFNTYPTTSLSASGEAVGLPAGQMGNSEVGHLNIGAGRIVFQDLLKISQSIETGDFFKNPALNKVMDHVISTGTSLHLMGLLSDGGVHSHLSHLFALIDMAVNRGIDKVYIHCFLDGRDTSPRSASRYLADLLNHINGHEAVNIASIAGRYYAMDRDHRWDRIEKAYNAMVLKEGRLFNDPLSALKFAYDHGENDEFFIPSCIGDDKEARIKDSDGVIFFNFRPDRAREITRSLIDPNFLDFKREKYPENLSFCAMTDYDSSLHEVADFGVAFPSEDLKNTFGEYISSLGFTQLRIAETEKYAHVTFFFNGGEEKKFPGESRILIPSPKVPTYDLKPEMSAFELTDEVLKAVNGECFDCIILNFANPDMVGHTGVFDAAVKAIEAVDVCIGKIEKAVLAKGGEILLTADHGNADLMVNKKNEIVTSHSLNPVPLVHIAGSPEKLLPGGKLCDIAPTMLDLMDLAKPLEMTGKSLIAKDHA